MDANHIKATYPLHWCVWMRDQLGLQKALDLKKHEIEKRDPRGRTPLLLAVTLDSLECTRILLDHNANVNAENKDGFSVFQEAVCTGNTELIQEILQRRDNQKNSSHTGQILEILKKIGKTRDFYVELKWEFRTKMPYVSGYLPSDTYKVYKSGSKVRIDTTLLDYVNNSWQRGNRSYVYKEQEDGVTKMEIDHTTRTVYSENLKVDTMLDSQPSQKSVSPYTKTPIVVALFNTDKVCLKRGHKGILGRKTEFEVVNGYQSKTFTAKNMELVIRTRTEHLTEADKKQYKSALTPFLAYWCNFKDEEEIDLHVMNSEYSKNFPYNFITPDKYFNSKIDLLGRDIGHPKEMSTRIKTFKENLWVCYNYPLSFTDQIVPIIDLMTINYTEFAKVRDFIRLPPGKGFPIKIEIPVFSSLDLSIDFQNESTFRLPDCLFEAPFGYEQLDCGGPRSIDINDKLLQDAIRQLLEEAEKEEKEMAKLQSFAAEKPKGNVCESSEEPGHESLPSIPPLMDEAAQAEEERQLLEEQEILERALRMSLGCM